MFDYKVIPLTQGKFAKVSPEDYDHLSQFKWSYLANGGYARRGVYTRISKGKYKTESILMHREIVKAKETDFVDHKNFDGLDCTRENLRICTQQENNWHRSQLKNNTSGYKGISWSKQAKQWQVQVWKDYRVVYSKLAKTLREAIELYNIAALHYHGEFAITHQLKQGGIL